jgi:CheY-like chemotaxis protein
VQQLTLSQAVDLARSNLEQIRGSTREIIFDLQSKATVVADRAQLARVITDLVENAVEACESAPLIQIVTWDDAKHVNLTVEDNGTGVPAEERECIFDPLYTTHAERGALGMGLARATLIARRHGGTIAIDCPPAGGSCLHLRLPRPKGSSVPLAATRHARRRAKAKVLIVEDQPEVAAQYFRVLSAHYDVQIASSAREAHSAVERDFFEVIISAVAMAKESGVSFARRLLRKNPAQAERIIFCTAGIVDQEAAAFVQRWQNGCMRKPISPRALKARLANFLATVHPEDS